MLKEDDNVILTKTAVGHYGNTFEPGDAGLISRVHPTRKDTGASNYTVEFSRFNGGVFAQATVKESQLGAVSGRDIYHVRTY